MQHPTNSFGDTLKWIEFNLLKFSRELAGAFQEAGSIIPIAQEEAVAFHGS